jgi:hypothetical protein
MSENPSCIYALGPEGTFSDQAARHLRALREGDGVGINYTRTIP